MKYTSTRGGVSGLSFEEALFSGFAPDGGLYVCESIPQISGETLREWRDAKLTYEQVVTKVVRLFVTPDEIPDEILELSVRRAYHQKFSHSQVINFAPLLLSQPTPSSPPPPASSYGDNQAIQQGKAETKKDGEDDDSETVSSSDLLTREKVKKKGEEEGECLVKIAELFHGPTGSFKDLALSLIGQFMQYFVNKRKSHVTILVGTSGDTGSAAIESVRSMPGVDIIVLYPKGMVTPIQEFQMLSVLDENVHIFEVEGTSDDLDIPIKQCFPQAGLISINSINWARIMIQVSHYAYIFVSEGSEVDEVDVIVPTGAAGNLVSGVLARQMGIPIKLYAATNDNDGLNVLFQEGRLEMGGQVLRTPANAMDIRNPYNVERLLYFFTNGGRGGGGGDPTLIASLMEKAELGPVNIPKDIMDRISTVIAGSMSVDTTLIYKTIKNCWKENHYMVCPHTATGLALFYEKFLPSSSSSSSSSSSYAAAAAMGVSKRKSHHDRRHRHHHRPAYILSTASPHKFPECALQVGIPSELWDGNRLLSKLQDANKKIPKEMNKGQDWLKMIQDEINAIKYNSL